MIDLNFETDTNANEYIKVYTARLMLIKETELLRLMTY